MKRAASTASGTPAQQAPDPETGEVPVFSVFRPEELAALTQRIIDSGQLGRSRIYASLLNYLLTCARENRTPKEIEIALDVLGRGADFDVSRDSVVRVYIHQLRKRLAAYYQRYEQDAGYRLVIPKGQYLLAAQAVPEKGSGPASRGEPGERGTARRSGFALAALLVVTNLVWLITTLVNNDADDPVALTASHNMWAAMADDDLPILLVMGDYYIFGEQDNSGRISRMIRDFSINSSADLENRLRQQPEGPGQYLDLNLNYLPEGSAFALSRLMPVLQATGKRINVTMMSRLNTADLKNSHIVYVGYISALDKLDTLVFASSGLQIGRTYDELYNRGTGEIYSSDAGLPQENQPFRDYALLSTFPAPGGIQMVIIAGTRDAGLMHSAQAAADASQLRLIENSLELPYSSRFASHEALFEVFGFERMNFDANLVYSRVLDSSRIWGGELSTR